MTNQQIARILLEMALYCEMDEIPFKPQAYERASLAVSTLDTSVAEVLSQGGSKALTKIPGIGKSIAEHIQQLENVGTFPEYEKYKQKFPVDVLELKRVQGLGPKMIKALWKSLQIKNLAEL